MVHIRFSLQELVEAREHILSNEEPVTLPRLSRKTRIRYSSLWYMYNRSAPWLMTHVPIVRGRRGDADDTSASMRIVARRLRRKYGVVAYFLIGEELGMSAQAVKDYLKSHPRLRESLRCTPCWEAKYRIAASAIPVEERNSQTLARELKRRFRMGSVSRVNAYLRRNPGMRAELGLSCTDS